MTGSVECFDRDALADVECLTILGRFGSDFAILTANYGKGFAEVGKL